MDTQRNEVIVRLASPELDEVLKLMFKRYPSKEWATFSRFGWRESKKGLVLTLAVVDPPTAGDLDESVGHVAIDASYSLRTALAAEKHPLCVGLFHSHPSDCIPKPSLIDDDMDGYYSGYFEDFAPGRPYLSMIVAASGKTITMSGRVFWRNQWFIVSRFIAERILVDTHGDSRKAVMQQDRWARLSSAFGQDATRRLNRATVAVIGAGGTGSMAIEVLARAGIGKLIVVDSDVLTSSNLERVHGSRPRDASKKVSKVLLAREHIHSINPTCEVEAYIGALPQSEVIDAVVKADVALGCTDQQHGRLSLSDIAVRYLVPSIDCGVTLEGSDGHITGQIVQLVRFLAADPCALCRGMTSPQRLSEELISPEEKARRQEEAKNAEARGEDPSPYWSGLPQLNTVGYLTGIAGALAAAYAIGLITGRFEAPFERMQFNLVAPLLDVNDVKQEPRPSCSCRKFRGWADQSLGNALISAPYHWPPVKMLPT